MKSITSKVNKDDMDNARLDRSIATNPADVEPGMSDFDWDDDDDFGGSFGGEVGGGPPTAGPFGSPEPAPFGGAPFGGAPFGGAPFGGAPFGGAPFGATEQPKKNDEIEDKFWGAIKKICVGTVTFTGEFVKSFKSFDIMVRMKSGKSIIIAGGITTIVGIILLLFGVSGLGLDLLVSGLISVGVGVPLFMFSYDDFKKNGAPPAVEPEPEPFMGDGFGMGDDEFDSFGSEDSDDDDFDLFGDEDDEDEDDFGSFDMEDDDTDFSAFEEPEMSEEEMSESRNAVLEGVNIDNGMVTRQYLYEQIVPCLPNVNKTFDNVRVISEGSDEFDAWDAIIQNSAKLFKPKSDDIEMPYLISAKDKIFYFILEIKRVSWIKNIDNFVSEIVNICRFDEETGQTDTNIYGIGNAVGDKIYIKIMKGETAMITVKDAYKNVEEDIKNSKNYMPIVIGLDAEGSVVWKDFKDINSILITGMPRSGKTWFVLAVLAQMAFYLKPSELHFYILDPKDQISDFKQISIPHIRKFVSTDESILSELRHVVRVEGPRRKKIIGDAGFVNIWDYKKKNPDVDLPLLYVVIDEVITLAERMDSDTKDEFQSLLLELVSQLPALGIRIFMIPHVVKDQVLKKSITDLIPCRISVRGDAPHIEKSVGVKNFKHKLTHQGDMAVRFNNDDPLFVHSVVLASSNEENSDLFDFMLKFWNKIEPESIKGSLYEKRQQKEQISSNIVNSSTDITIAAPKAENVTTVRETAPKGLSKEDADDLLKGLHATQPEEDDELDLWG